MRLQEALAQVRVIQAQVERTERICCFRSVTVAASGAMALAGAVIQASVIPDPAAAPVEYLIIWIAVAALSVAVIASEMGFRWFHSASAYGRRQTLVAVEQFAPCVVAGLLATVVIAAFAPDYRALYPALWSILFSLGVFASSRQLPGSIVVALYYLLAGVVVLGWAQGERALSPWAMVVTFGAGQLLMAANLFWRQERAYGEP